MKNTHLEHPEDSILTGDLSVLNWFVTEGDFSVKIDGAPAIVWGVDPANGEFFVGTKSVFNKKKIKINHSHEEIDQNHEGQVAIILHQCFDYLPRISGIVQGDFIGFGGTDEYKPNTITYKFPETVSQKIIIAPHTGYDAESDLRDAVAYPDVSVWKDTPDCKFVKPDAYVYSGSYDLPLHSFSDLKEVCDFAKQMAQTVEFTDSKGAMTLKKVFNAFIKIDADLDDEALAIIGKCDINLIRLWKLVKSIKEDALFLCRNDGPEAYLNGQRIDAEGYVMTNQYGMFKLVNREVFSRENFNNGKFQSAN